MQKGYNLYNLEPQFKNFLIAENISPISLKNYLSDFRYFLGWIAHSSNPIKEIESINTVVIAEYRDYLQKNNLPHKTINRRLSTIRKFCTFCISQGWLKENPAKKIANIGQKIIEASTPVTPSLTYNKALIGPKGVFNKVFQLPAVIINRIKSFKFGQSEPIKNEVDKPLSMGIQHYVGLIIMLIFMSVLGAGIYNQFFSKSQQSFAYPTTLTRAGRILSFQGRLTDSLGNPITTATNITFNLYNVSSGGTALYTAGPCSTTPDQDGVFNVLIGGSGYSPTPPTSVYNTVCGSEIDASIFSENANVYLGVTVASDSEMTPRQQIANVGYALNAETLQGFPPGTNAASIPYINSDGDVLIAASNPNLASTYTSSTFTISSANATTIQSAGSGDITLQATESGAISLRTGGSTSAYTRLFVDTDANGGNVGIGTITPSQKLDVFGGDAVIRDATDLGSETLTNGALTSGTSWSVANDAALAADAATWTFSAGTASTLTQASGSLAIAGVGSRWYKFVYTVSGLTGTPTANITTAFASSSTALTLTAGTQTTYFKSASSPTDFIITSTLTSGQAFTLDDLSLKEVQGGDLAVNGIITGGGTSGIKILANGRVGIGDTSPDHLLDVAGNIGLDAGSYINFGDTDGTTGYGFRDNSGAIEFKNSTGDWTEIGTGSGGSSVWSALTDPTGNLALSMTTHTTTFNWDTGTGTSDLFSLTTDDSSNGTGYLLNLQTGTSSTVNPLRIRSGSTEALSVNSSGNVGVGTIGQDRKLDVLDASNPQLRLTQADNSVYADFQMTSAGDLIMNVDGVSNQFVLDNGGNVGIGDTSPAALFTVGNGDLFQVDSSGNVSIDNQADLRLLEADANGSNYTGFQAPAALAGDVVYTLPDADGTSGFVLQTNGTGTLSWQNINSSQDVGPWTVLNGSIYPDNSTLDLFIGGSASDSAKFAFLNVDSGDPTASISGNLALTVPEGADPATSLNVLNGGSLSLATSVGGNVGLISRFYITNAGDIGIGTTSPSQKLTIQQDNVADMLGIKDGANNTSLLIADGGVATFKPTAFDFVYTFDGVSAYADNTTEAKSSGGTAFTILAAENPSDDGFYMGLDHKYGTIYLDIETAGVGVTLLRHYWNGSTWASLTSTDNTSNLTTDGTITFTAPTDWETTAVNSQTKYWIRLSSSTQVTTAPTANSVSPTTGSRFSVFAQSGDTTNPSLYVNDIGNVGIGTNSPNSKLSIGGSASTITNNSGDITIDAASGNISLNGDSLINFTQALGATGSSGTPTYSFTGDGNTGMFSPGAETLAFSTNSTEIMRIDSSGRVGINTTGADQRLDILDSAAPQLRLTQADGTVYANFQMNSSGDLVINVDGASNQLVLDNAGNVGIGTAAPNASYPLHVSGNILADALYDTTSPGTWFLNPAGASNLGGNITMVGDLIMNDGSPLITSNNAGSYNTITLKGSNDTTSASVCIEGTGTGTNCDGKLNVGTIDPPYTINGKKYATYFAAMTGVKEETTGTVETTEKIDGIGYRTVINFDQQSEGSDLWLFSKVTNLRENIDKMVVLTTPSENTRTWYKFDKQKLQLQFFSSRPTTIAYRLTAPRFDYQKWGNKRPITDIVRGFLLNNQDNKSAPDNTAPTAPTYSLTNEKQVVYNGNLNEFVNDNLLYKISGDFVEEVLAVNQAVFAKVKSGFIEAENIIVRGATVVQDLIATNKIASPVVETSNLKVTDKAKIKEVQTNEIKPQSNNLTVNLEQPENPGALAKLIIKGLEGKTVTTIDAHGNASFSGQIVADSLSIDSNATIAGTLDANQVNTNEASISGKLTAKEIQSETIDNLSTNINDIQQLIANINNEPAPEPANYQNLSEVEFADVETSQLTVSGSSNLYNVSVSGSILVGTTIIDQNSITSLSSELKLNALSSVNFFNGAVVIAKDGTITTQGTLIAQGGIKTNEIKPLTDGGQVAIDSLAVNKLAFEDKYFEATDSAAVIAAPENFALNGIFAPAIETASSSAGIGILPENASEVIVYNNNIKNESLVYLTPTSDYPISNQLTVVEKVTGDKPYFKVSSNVINALPIKFNWLIVN